MNVLMQLRKVCNHPDLFEARTIESPFIMQERVHYPYPTLIYKDLMQYDPLKHIDYSALHCLLPEVESMTTTEYSRLQELYPRKPLVQVVTSDKLLQTRPLADGLAVGRRVPVNCNVLTVENTMNLKRQTLSQVLPFYDSNVAYLEEQVPPYLNTACVPFVQEYFSLENFDEMRVHYAGGKAY